MLACSYVVCLPPKPSSESTADGVFEFLCLLAEVTCSMSTSMCTVDRVSYVHGWFLYCVSMCACIPVTRVHVLGSMETGVLVIVL